jgi:hypothetical protein
MIFVDQLFDIDAAQHKLLSIDSGKSRLMQARRGRSHPQFTDPGSFRNDVVGSGGNFFTASCPRISSHRFSRTGLYFAHAMKPKPITLEF